MFPDPNFATARWDDPFWHAFRMLVDEIPSRGKYASGLDEEQVIPALAKKGTSAAAGLVQYLKGQDSLVRDLAEYSKFRYSLSQSLLAMMRTEEQAKSDYRALTGEMAQSYGVQLDGYHKSSKVLVNTVHALTKRECDTHGVAFNTDPQTRAAMLPDGHLWVSPRRLDGAIPSLLNPVSIWEIKEYWGRTNGGSKMSDAVYEMQLVGTELRKFEDEFGVSTKHYAIIDGYNQWVSRKSDLRRAIDLVHSGLLDGLIVGSEVLTEWPKIVRDSMDELNQNHSAGPR